MNVGIVGAGFILDLREDVSAPLPRPPGLVIEGEAVDSSRGLRLRPEAAATAADRVRSEFLVFCQFFLGLEIN